MQKPRPEFRIGALICDAHLEMQFDSEKNATKADQDVYVGDLNPNASILQITAAFFFSEAQIAWARPQ